MAKRNGKRNGKAHTLVVSAPVRLRPAAAYQEEVTTLLPGPVRTAADVLALLDEVSVWLEGLEAMISADCSRWALHAVAFDSRRVLEGCIEALREGRFPRFILDTYRAETWIEEARRVLVYARGTGYDEEIVERLLLVAERGRKASEASGAQEATR